MGVPSDGKCMKNLNQLKRDRINSIGFSLLRTQEQNHDTDNANEYLITSSPKIRKIDDNHEKSKQIIDKKISLRTERKNRQHPLRLTQEENIRNQLIKMLSFNNESFNQTLLLSKAKNTFSPSFPSVNFYFLNFFLCKILFQR